MPHLDDGTLHAYLDGALSTRDTDGSHVGIGGAEHRGDPSDTDDQPSRAEVERHLTECPECRDALNEARRVRDEAGRILSAAAPDDVKMPPFEDLERMAKRRSTADAVASRSSLSRMRYLAWAATVVVAAAVGWYARSAVISSYRGQQVSDAESGGSLTMQVPAPERSATSADSEEVPPATPSDLEGGSEPAEEVAETVGEMRHSREQEPVANDLDEGGGATVTAVSPEQQETVAQEAEQRNRLEEPRARPVPVARESAAPMMARVAGDRSVGLEDSWAPASKSQAETFLAQPIPIVEGLPVIDYAISQIAEERTVRIRQALDSNSSVVLTVVSGSVDELPSGDKKGVATARSSADSSVTVLRDNLRISVSAAVTADSLRVLADRISTR